MCSTPSHSLDTIQLSDIDLAKLTLVKKSRTQIDGRDHSRWVFRTPRHLCAAADVLYYKIWNPSYIRRDHLLRGIESGFYDESTTPALKALIYANGLCRGYATRKCLPNRKKDCDFFRHIVDRTVQTGFFAVQYSRYHTMRYGERYSLVDLE